MSVLIKLTIYMIKSQLYKSTSIELSLGPIRALTLHQGTAK